MGGNTPIFDANYLTIEMSDGNVPNISDAMNGWFQFLTFTRVSTSVINFQSVQMTTSYDFQGIVQPFTAQQLMQVPEGQRKWRWQKIHAVPFSLSPGEYITFKNRQYRVMSKEDYTQYGYICYDIVEGYTP